MTNTISNSDLKLLLALDMNARASLSQLGKNVGMSKQLVGYKLKKLEKKIIKSYYPVVNHNLLGYKLYRVAIKLVNTNNETLKEIISYLKSNSSWMASVLGNYDFSLAIYVKDENEFMVFWNNFYKKFSYFVAERWISLMTEFYNYERSFFYPQKKNRERVFEISHDSQVSEVDEIDIKILKELEKNARQTSLLISKNIKCSERVVRYRIKKLEEKVILGYRTFLDMEKLGYYFYKIFLSLQNVSYLEINKIRRYISQNINVVYSTVALGGYDFEFEMYEKSSKELFQFFQNIKKQFPNKIKTIAHMEYMKEYKVSYLP